jgi:hypothetical protein
MKTHLGAGSVAMLFASIAFSQGLAQPVKDLTTPEALKTEIEALRPAKHVWREIQWMTCPLKALKESRAQNKPVITWVFLGIPTDERC